MIGFSSNSNFSTSLFAGQSYNSYQIIIYVQVYDQDEAFSVYKIGYKIIVKPDFTDINIIKDKIITADPYLSANIILNQGSYLSSVQIIQTISSLLNDESFSDKLAMILNKSSIAFPEIYGPMANFSGVIPVSLKAFA